MPTSSSHLKCKAAQSYTGIPLQLLATSVVFTMWGPFFSSVISFIAAVLAICTSCSSGAQCCVGVDEDDWEVKKKYWKSSACCNTPRYSSVAQLFAWTAAFAFFNVVGSGIQAGILLSCNEGKYEYDYMHYPDTYYYDDPYDDSVCQGYRYDFDLILGMKPQNSDSATPFTYCTEEYVTSSLSNKLVELWMAEQEMLDTEDAQDYCTNIPVSWTVPASSYANFLDGTDQYSTCVDYEIMDLYFMDFMDSCTEGDDGVVCSLTDDMAEQCTEEEINKKITGEQNSYMQCYECKAMTVSLVTGCYCKCSLDGKMEGLKETPQKVFNETDSDIMVVAQFEEYHYAYATDAHGYYYERNHGDCYLGGSSLIFGSAALANAIFSFLLFCLALRKQGQWTQLGAAIKKADSEEGSGGMMELTPVVEGRGQVHPLNTAPSQQPLFVQLPNGQYGQVMPFQPVTFGGGMMTAAAPTIADKYTL
eukprot:CAMPEP_0118649778 /NCGR_PEP_ID=MMETSP0785-20121206/9887_1 /TAXON_ID=91992 /ORGANISM="Bolidomonas pacifica, Strain CCMP 1866" /LENGTH=474 /DNA_ID=CAMNT_0006542093 /DNA_START=145 /DNA_END=1569 /DNA_ORIENTATION=+